MLLRDVFLATNSETEVHMRGNKKISAERAQATALEMLRAVINQVRGEATRWVHWDMVVTNATETRQDFTVEIFTYMGDIKVHGNILFQHDPILKAGNWKFCNFALTFAGNEKTTFATCELIGLNSNYDIVTKE